MWHFPPSASWSAPVPSPFCLPVFLGMIVVPEQADIYCYFWFFLFVCLPHLSSAFCAPGPLRWLSLPRSSVLPAFPVFISWETSKFLGIRPLNPVPTTSSKTIKFQSNQALLHQRAGTPLFVSCVTKKQIVEGNEMGWDGHRRGLHNSIHSRISSRLYQNGSHFVCFSSIQDFTCLGPQCIQG